VGILSDVNGEEATVTLKDVKPFGTEGRLDDPTKEIPPSGEIYPIVIFRGSDVQDLSVLDYPDQGEQQPQEVKEEEKVQEKVQAEPQVEIPPRRAPPRRQQDNAFNATVPDSDFDFSKTESLDESKDELQRPRDDGAFEPAYDKKKSFFDNISNSANETRPQRSNYGRRGGRGGQWTRGRGRADWS
jgi:protein LSM14